MQPDSPRTCLQALAARGRDPLLVGWTGTWEFDLAEGETWSVQVDDGKVSLREGVSPATSATAHFHMRGEDLVKLLYGRDHENLLTSVLRGALLVSGDLGFGVRLAAVLPIQSDVQRAAKGEARS